MPDVFLLSSLVYSLDGDLMIQAYPDLFRQLIADPEESIEDMMGNDLGFVITHGGINARFRDAMCIAFTPRSDRAHFYENVHGLRKRREEHLSVNLPDLSKLRTTEERYDAVVDLLTFDIFDALEEVLPDFGLTVTELPDLRQSDPNLFRTFHRLAGYIYSSRNLYAIFTDLKRGGKNNLFNNRVDLGDDPQTTEFGQCPGVSYARNFLESVGASLSANRETVLGVINSSN